MFQGSLAVLDLLLLTDESIRITNDDHHYPRDHISAQVLMGNKLIFRGRVTGLSLAMLGSVGVILALAVPFLARSPILAFILMSLPTFFIGAVALLHGIAVLSACIEITDTELKLAVPKWRGFPLPPVRRVTLNWHELVAVRHRKEVYQFLGTLSFPVEVFAIDTTQGRIVLGQRSIPGLRKALVEMIGRAGLIIQEEGEVSPGLMRTLLKGSPPWRS